MSESPNPEPEKKPPVVSKWFKGLGCGALVLLCLAVLGFPSVFLEMNFRLIAGWGFFLGRVLPLVSWDFTMIGSGLLALAIAAWGFHLIARHIREGWKKSWTAAWILVGGLLFTASIFTTGLVQQTVWLFREPMVVGPYHRINSTRTVSNIRLHLLALRVYREDEDRFPERLYDLYPDYIDVPFGEGNFWTVKQPGGEDLEHLYFPDVIKLSETVNEGDMIVIASPPIQGKQAVGFLNGVVIRMPEQEFREKLGKQQKMLFERYQLIHEARP